MILRLILKREGTYKTKDIIFFFTEDGDGRSYGIEKLSQEEMTGIFIGEVVGVEIIEEDSDK